MTGIKLRVGTRGSKLSLAQVREFTSLLNRLRPDVRFEIVVIKTRGDVDTKTPLYMMKEKGVFEREINKALAEGEVDLAVHSAKDLPTDYGDGLVLAAVPPRRSPYDALVARSGGGLEALPQGAVVGTSSLRRICFLKYARRDLRVRPIRGNLDTRLSKLAGGEYDAVVVAEAGIERLGLDVGFQRLDPDVFVPAAGQGALAILARRDDARVVSLLRLADDPRSRIELLVEKEVVRLVGAGCRTPIGVHARCGADLRSVRVTVAAVTPDFDELVKVARTYRIAGEPDVRDVAAKVADEFTEVGGVDVIKSWRGRGVPADG